MTRRRWIADTWTDTHATLTGAQAEHLVRVLRATPGQVYDVVAGGFLHRAEITSVQPTEVCFALHEELESDTALPLHLLLAVFKFDHMEWAIEKATELGVARLTPIMRSPNRKTPRPRQLQESGTIGGASRSRPQSNRVELRFPRSPIRFCRLLSKARSNQ